VCLLCAPPARHLRSRTHTHHADDAPPRAAPRRHAARTLSAGFYDVMLRLAQLPVPPATALAGLGGASLESVMTAPTGCAGPAALIGGGRGGGGESGVGPGGKALG
jgi:hypothetical protein